MNTNSVLKICLNKNYHRVVTHSFQGDLKFFVNGDCQGVAAANLPQMLYAVVDMYGKCAQVTVTAPSTPDSSGFTFMALTFPIEYKFGLLNLV